MARKIYFLGVAGKLRNITLQCSEITLALTMGLVWLNLLNHTAKMPLRLFLRWPGARRTKKRGDGEAFLTEGRIANHARAVLNDTSSLIGCFHKNAVSNLNKSLPDSNCQKIT